jgi:hypothetical protein
MASSRVLSRLLAPTTLNRLLTISSRNGSVRSFFHHCHGKHLPEAYSGSASNVIQRWEKEFDRMQKQVSDYFGYLKNNRSVVNYSPGGNGKFYFM